MIIKLLSMTNTKNNQILDYQITVNGKALLSKIISMLHPITSRRQAKVLGIVIYLLSLGLSSIPSIMRPRLGWLS